MNRANGAAPQVPFLPQEVQQGCYRHRPAHPEALRLRAAGLDQKVIHHLAFDALGHHLDAQAVRHLDAAMDNRAAAAARGQPLNQALMQLDGGERPLAEHIEGRIAGAKIIHGQADAEVRQRLHLPAHLLRTLEQRGFGQFHLEQARVDGRVLDPLPQGRHHHVRLEILRDQIERQAQARLYRLHRREIRQQSIQQRQHDGLHQPRRLGGRHEFVGQDHLTVRPDPAQQRLHTGDPSVMQVDLGLIVIGQFTKGQRQGDRGIRTRLQPDVIPGRPTFPRAGALNGR